MMRKRWGILNRKNVNLTPSEKAERAEMDNVLAVERLMADLTIVDEADFAGANSSDQTAIVLMGALSASLCGDLVDMRKLVASLSVDEVKGCYQAVNVLLANLLAKDAAGSIQEYK